MTTNPHDPTAEEQFEEWYSNWCSNICEVDPKFKDQYKASFYHAYLIQKDHYESKLSACQQQLEKAQEALRLIARMSYSEHFIDIFNVTKEALSEKL